MSIFRKQGIEMKMDTYINGFCSSLKSDILRGKYKQVIESTQKFIQRQANSLQTFSRNSIIYLLYLETYCCHKIIFKLALKANDSSSVYQTKSTLQIMIRNLKKMMCLIADFLENRQIIVNFGSQNLKKNKQSNYRNTNCSSNSNNSEISQKSFISFLQATVWIIKDITILLNTKRSVILKSQILEAAVKFLQLISNVVKKKRISHRAHQLQVRCLFIVFLYQSKQYQRGQRYVQKSITETYSLLFHLNHEYKKIVKKSYKILFIILIYQSYFHIHQNSFHNIESLLCILKKLQTLQGPRQLIKYYNAYQQIRKQFTIISQVQQQLSLYFSNGEIFSINAIFNIIQNSDKMGVKEEEGKGKDQGQYSGGVKGDNWRKSKVSIVRKRDKSEIMNSGIRNNYIKSSVDFVVEEKKNKMLGRISQMFCEQKKSIIMKQSRVKFDKKSRERLQKSNSFSLGKRVIKVKNVNLQVFKQDSQQDEEDSQLEHRQTKCDLKAKQQTHSLFQQSQTPTVSIINKPVIQNKQIQVLKKVNKNNKNKVQFDSQIQQSNLKSKKSELLIKKRQNKMTQDLFQSKIENCNQDQIKNVIQNYEKNKKKYEEQTGIKRYQSDSYSQLSSFQSSKKMLCFHNLIGQKMNMNKSMTKRPKKVSQAYFCKGARNDIKEEVSQTHKNVYSLFIQILLKNKSKLSIQVYANKLQMHLKRQQIKKMKAEKLNSMTRLGNFDKKHQNRYYSFYGNKARNQNIYSLQNAQQKNNYQIGFRSPKKMKSLNLQNKNSKSSKDGNVNFAEVLQQYDMSGNRKYNLVKKQNFAKIQEQNEKNLSSKQKFKKRQEAIKYKTILLNQKKDLKERNMNTIEDQKIFNEKTVSRFVSKYDKITCRQFSIPQGITQQEYQKMLHLSYQKSRQSIEEVTKKMINHENSMHRKNYKKRGLRFSQNSFQICE